MSLAACARPTVEPASPTVVIRQVKETPPSDLTACPSPVMGIPTTGQAQIPAEWRAAIIRLSAALAARTDQLERLIAWNTERPCGALQVSEQP